MLDALSPVTPVVLVAHDASGPPAIDYALLQPRRVAALARLPVPVRVVFGASDPYLNPRVAREMAGWFGVEPVLVPDAGHYVQVDAPGAVAEQILA